MTVLEHLNRPLVVLVSLWLGWALLIISFQTLVDRRFQPDRPDEVLEWTGRETTRRSQNDKIYLVNPFMNRQVSWDSEFYLSIAAVGYDDPAVRLVQIPDQAPRSMNYAFFPFYPTAIRAVAAPLRALGMEIIPAVTLAGVVVAALGTLGGMIALYDLTRDELMDAGGLRTAFYLLIFPSSFFLVQVYTEGLFVGLAFGALALLRRGHLLPAAALAALATWTRAVGGALVIPLALAWGTALWAAYRQRSVSPLLIVKGLLPLAPVGAYLLWRLVYGESFELVETYWFGRDIFDLAGSWDAWRRAWESLGGNNSARVVYYLLEFGSIGLALMACLFTLRRYPGLALFGLAALVIVVTSGSAQSMIRYVLVVPSLYIFLARLGRWAAFDRAWTVAGVLLMGLLATLFTFDMWVA